MEKPPIEWIEKLFICMEQFYGKRWSKQFDQFMPISLAKTIWQSALAGCTYDEIRNVLLLLKQAADKSTLLPPGHMEFYEFCKGKVPIMPIEKLVLRRNTDLARAAISEIRNNLLRKSAS